MLQILGGSIIGVLLCMGGIFLSNLDTIQCKHRVDALRRAMVACGILLTVLTVAMLCVKVYV